jgi:4-amino-4-deoxy-L-arabinose transferase-like glycosyltransferase
MRQRTADWLQRAERGAQNGLAWCASDPRRAAVLLVLLCLALHLPGLFSRPPVDRTEVYYALSARHMLESGDFLVPRDPARLALGRPIGFVWLEALFASIFGPGTLDAIWAYRLPSLLGAILSAFALFFGMRPIAGPKAALCAAALLAGAIIVAIQSRLALPQSMTLAAALVAMTSLARVYLAGSPLAPPASKATALLFWGALGVSVLLNSWIVPILALLTVLGLIVQDRSLAWLGRLHAALGVPLLLLLAVPWIGSVIRSAAEADEARSLLQWVALLADAQTMKYRAFPGYYLLMTWLGFWPLILFLLPAGQMVWEKRHLPEFRFLLAWLVPYVVVMELVSHKPPLYMLGYVVPVLAVATALRVTPNPITGPPAPVSIGVLPIAGWMALGTAVSIAPLILQGWFAEPLTAAMLMAAAMVLAATAAAAAAARFGFPLAALGLSLVSGAGVYWLVFSLLLPADSRFWPAAHMAKLREAVESCYDDPVLVSGYTEPSVYFLLGRRTAIAPGMAVPVYLESNPRGMAFLERSEEGRLASALEAPGTLRPATLACISSHNPFTNRRGEFRVLVRGPFPQDAKCQPPEQYRCPPAR